MAIPVGTQLGTVGLESLGRAADGTLRLATWSVTSAVRTAGAGAAFVNVGEASDLKRVCCMYALFASPTCLKTKRTRVVGAAERLGTTEQLRLRQQLVLVWPCTIPHSVLPTATLAERPEAPPLRSAVSSRCTLSSCAPCRAHCHGKNLVLRCRIWCGCWSYWGPWKAGRLCKGRCDGSTAICS